jgi:hypothetical protein
MCANVNIPTWGFVSELLDSDVLASFGEITLPKNKVFTTP